MALDLTKCTIEQAKSDPTLDVVVCDEDDIQRWRCAGKLSLLAQERSGDLKGRLGKLRDEARRLGEQIEASEASAQFEVDSALRAIGKRHGREIPMSMTNSAAILGDGQSTLAFAWPRPVPPVEPSPADKKEGGS